MGDMGEVFRDMREHKKERRASNTVSSTELLQKFGIRFKVHNMGAHLIVTAKDDIFDFWPSTGLYRSRATGDKRRGVFGLLKACGVTQEAIAEYKS